MQDHRTENHKPAPIDLVVKPLAEFLRIEAASGGFLLACTVAALVVANSQWAGPFFDFWQTRAGLAVGGWQLFKPLLLWVNDGLMTIFFFVVGLEIKRELVDGELSEPRKAALPILGALGGMVAPACVFLLLQYGQPGADRGGWAIPMATDIAFVVGFLSLLGRRVPSGLKIFLLSLAIVDDLGAVLIIALVFTDNLALEALRWAGLGFAIVLLLRLLGVRRVPVYVVVGAAVWYAVLKSGIHPTVAGVLLGLLTPTGPVLNRLEHALHPWVGFLIMPLFALANAGVAVDLASITDPLAVAVAAGLVIGKPLGIVLVSLLGVWAGLASLPRGMDVKVLIGAGCLGGIGFTMSLFICGLALGNAPDLLDAGKVGTLTGSAISAALGMVLLFLFLRRRPDEETAEDEESENLTDATV